MSEYRRMAARMGCTTSLAPDAEPWSSADADAYAAKHGNRAFPTAYPSLPDVQIAGVVRMLMRDDLDHEAVVCAARDRICALHVEKAALASERLKDRLMMSVLLESLKEAIAAFGSSPVPVGFYERAIDVIALAEASATPEPTSRSAA